MHSFCVVREKQKQNQFRFKTAGKVPVLFPCRQDTVEILWGKDGVHNPTVLVFHQSYVQPMGSLRLCTGPSLWTKGRRGFKSRFEQKVFAE